MEDLVLVLIGLSVFWMITRREAIYKGFKKVCVAPEKEVIPQGKTKQEKTDELNLLLLNPNIEHYYDKLVGMLIRLESRGIVNFDFEMEQSVFLSKAMQIFKMHNPYVKIYYNEYESDNRAWYFHVRINYSNKIIERLT